MTDDAVSGLGNRQFFQGWERLKTQGLLPFDLF